MHKLLLKVWALNSVPDLRNSDNYLNLTGVDSMPYLLMHLKHSETTVINTTEMHLNKKDTLN